MLSLMRRAVLVGVLTVLFATSWLPVSRLQAQTGDWEYVPELGGYLDWDTGLVWGEHSMNWMYPQYGPGWDYVNDTWLPTYRAQTGIAAWRLPTVAEAQVAAAHGINPVINNRFPLIPCWTSETKKIKGVWSAYVVYLYNGAVGTKAISSPSGLPFVPVYRAFTP